MATDWIEVTPLKPVDGNNAPHRIAVDITPGKGPTVLWLNGFRSSMTSSKSTDAAAWGRFTGRRVVRMDYSGHGISGGRFEDGTISQWAADAAAVFQAFCVEGPLVLAGSSMGGWIALLLARLPEVKARLAGVLLVAPAPDFTSALMEPKFTPADTEALRIQGFIEAANDYAPEPLIITRALIEDGRDNNLLDRPMTIGAPVRILQGMKDEDVPYTHAFRIVDTLADDDVTVTLVKDGNHSLSRPQDLDLIHSALEKLCA